MIALVLQSAPKKDFAIAKVREGAAGGQMPRLYIRYIYTNNIYIYILYIRYWNILDIRVYLYILDIYMYIYTNVF